MIRYFSELTHVQRFNEKPCSQKMYTPSIKEFCLWCRYIPFVYFFSCPGQLNRWHCQWVSQWVSEWVSHLLILASSVFLTLTTVVFVSIAFLISHYNHYNHYNFYNVYNHYRDRDSDLDLDLDWGVVIYNQIVTWTAFAILAMFLSMLPLLNCPKSGKRKGRS